MSDQTAIDLVNDQNPDDPQKAAEALVKSALDNMSQDNLSAMVIRFHHPFHTTNGQDQKE